MGHPSFVWETELAASFNGYGFENLIPIRGG
jgi:hypothetical protein